MSNVSATHYSSANPILRFIITYVAVMFCAGLEDVSVVATMFIIRGILRFAFGCKVFIVAVGISPAFLRLSKARESILDFASEQKLFA